MCETKKLKMVDKVNINALGSHFDESLKSHQEKHNNHTVAESTRKRNAELLKGRLNNIVRSKKLRRSDKTIYYSIPDLDSGTDVSFRLSTQGTTLAEAIKKMVEPDGSFYQDYLKEGAICQNKDPNTVDEITKNRLIRERISIFANLETSSGKTITRDEVYVCTILDPATILIPDKDDKYIQIGPDDTKFISLLSTVSLVNERVKGSKKRIPIPKILPVVASVKKIKVRKSKAKALSLVEATKIRKNKLSKKLKYKSALKFAVPVIAVALLACIGWVSYKKISTKSYFSTTSLTSVSDPSAYKYVGWKEYCSSTGGLCFMYPKTWSISTTPEPTRSTEHIELADITSPSGSTTVEYQPVCPEPTVPIGKYTDNILSVASPAYSASFRVVKAISTYSPANSRSLITADSLYLTSASLAKKDGLTVGTHSGATSLTDEKINMYFDNPYAATPNITQCLYVKSTSSQFNSSDSAQDWFSTPDAITADEILKSSL